MAHNTDTKLLAVAAVLAAARLLSDSPVSLAALVAACPALSSLTSLHLTTVHPLSFCWPELLPRLKSFDLVDSAGPSSDDADGADGDKHRATGALPLERLWQRCGSLKWLQQRACDGTGDGRVSLTLCIQQRAAGLHTLNLRLQSAR